MNGAQDLGGMMGFGPVRPEADEPVFHEEWERRAFALTLAMGFTGQWNIDMARFARESLPPARYLSSSYYEIWFEGLRRLLLDLGLVTEDELASGRSAGPGRDGVVALPASGVAVALQRGGPSERPARAPARFAPGDAVRARVMHPLHHTRLPRYLRGKPGRVVAVHGAHVFPDSNAQAAGENPQWLYGVRFEASEVWGRDTTAASICADCWEPYLEPLQP
ncbi:MAG TPA: nitrile hydratase subunit beta [Quisquiliibacterium sp.]|nr:nitrile hydratase subunit beta [Quisquiliibacterium sp.]